MCIQEQSSPKNAGRAHQASTWLCHVERLEICSVAVVLVLSHFGFVGSLLAPMSVFAPRWPMPRVQSSTKQTMSEGLEAIMLALRHVCSSRRVPPQPPSRRGTTNGIGTPFDGFLVRPLVILYKTDTSMLNCHLAFSLNVICSKLFYLGPEIPFVCLFPDHPLYCKVQSKYSCSDCSSFPVNGHVVFKNKNNNPLPTQDEAAVRLKPLF